MDTFCILSCLYIIEQDTNLGSLCYVSQEFDNLQQSFELFVKSQQESYTLTMRKSDKYKALHKHRNLHIGLLVP